MIAGTTSQLKLTILIFIWENFPKKGISGQKRKSRTCACVHCRYYIKLFRTGADRHNGILMSLLLLVAETMRFPKLFRNMDSIIYIIAALQRCS